MADSNLEVVPPSISSAVEQFVRNPNSGIAQEFQVADRVFVGFFEKNDVGHAYVYVPDPDYVSNGLEQVPDNLKNVSEEFTRLTAELRYLIDRVVPGVDGQNLHFSLCATESGGNGVYYSVRFSLPTSDESEQVAAPVKQEPLCDFV